MGKHPGELIGCLQSSSTAESNINQHKDALLDPRLPPPATQSMSDKLTLVKSIAVSCLATNPQSRPTRRTVSKLLDATPADYLAKLVPVKIMITIVCMCLWCIGDVFFL